MKFHYSENLFQGPVVWCSNNKLFEGGVYSDQYACAYTASTISLFVYMYNARARMRYAIDPLPCNEISRAVFTGTSWQKYTATFRGNTVCEFLCCMHALFGIPYSQKVWRGIKFGGLAV